MGGGVVGQKMQLASTLDRDSGNAESGPMWKHTRIIALHFKHGCTDDSHPLLRLPFDHAYQNYINALALGISIHDMVDCEPYIYIESSMYHTHTHTYTYTRTCTYTHEQT